MCEVKKVGMKEKKIMQISKITALLESKYKPVFDLFNQLIKNIHSV